MDSLEEKTIKDRFRGCLLGGAVGDALGAPIEFLRRPEILRLYGPKGVVAYAPAFGGLGMITDDTQMTLFTAEGLLRAWVRGQSKGISSFTGMTALAYKRWLQTQDGEQVALSERELPDTGWLLKQPQLHHRRVPGVTCLEALRAMDFRALPASNNSKGCGGVMRMAPLGLLLWRRDLGVDAKEVFELGTELAALTHGHPTGSLAAGAFAVMIAALASGYPVAQALSLAMRALQAYGGHEETLEALQKAQSLAGSGLPHPDAIAMLGEGWVAEEALAIGVYCALVAKTFRQGVLLAVNHDGDSDSTGSIAGNLLGALYGEKRIPRAWLAELELKAVIREVADDLFGFPEWDIGEYTGDPAVQRRIWAKYPGH